MELNEIAVWQVQGFGAVCWPFAWGEKGTQDGLSVWIPQPKRWVVSGCNEGHEVGQKRVDWMCLLQKCIRIALEGGWGWIMCRACF